MSEVILVVLQRSDTAPALLAAAERLAALAGGAHLNVLAVTDAAPLALEACYRDWLDAPRATAVDARWSAIPEEAASAIEERGARADVIVIARPADDDDRGIRQVFRLALLRTGRPLLLVPPGLLSGRVIQTSGDAAFGHHAPATPDFGRVVAIAWRQDEHTAKAIVPALRYIRQAERVFLLAGLRKDGAPSLPDVLREHAVRAELHVMPIGPGAFGRALLVRAHDLAVDLLVMGAYAHGPLYNLVHGWLGYGGVTRFMLEHADLPVLMRY